MFAVIDAHACLHNHSNHVTTVMINVADYNYGEEPYMSLAM